MVDFIFFFILAATVVLFDWFYVRVLRGENKHLKKRMNQEMDRADELAKYIADYYHNQPDGGSTAHDKEAE